MRTSQTAALGGEGGLGELWTPTWPSCWLVPGPGALALKSGSAAQQLNDQPECKAAPSLRIQCCTCAMGTWLLPHGWGLGLRGALRMGWVSSRPRRCCRCRHSPAGDSPKASL